MFIQTEETPNPATMKFIPGKDVTGESGKTFYFKNSEEASSSPLALSLFDTDGVVGVFFGYDFITRCFSSSFIYFSICFTGLLKNPVS